MNDKYNSHLNAVKTQRQLRAVRDALDEMTAQDRLDFLQATIDKLPEDEREIIDEMADRLIDAVKRRNSRNALSKGGALEAIAKLGIWMNGRR